MIRSQRGTLLSLCQQFEELLQTHDPHLFFHMIQLGVHPLRVALPWIQFAFVPLLDPAEVLVLWDRVLGFDDLTVLPVLAAAISSLQSGHSSYSPFTDEKTHRIFQEECARRVAVFKEE